MSIEHLNPSGAVPPYRDLYSTVTIVSPGTTLAYVSSQWAGDEESNVLFPDDYHGQSKVVWTNIGKILKELGCGMKDVVHKGITVKYVLTESRKPVILVLTYEQGLRRRNRQSVSSRHDGGHARRGEVLVHELCALHQVLRIP
jgi:enamine deaminase RidA (YjgF/YER057c/UK114 family)